MSMCTTTDCNNPTDLYLCGSCIRDFDAWIAKGRDLLPDLDVTISKQDNVRVHSEGGGGGLSGSAAPLNVDALQLKSNLLSVDRGAQEYAKDEFAAGMAWLIQGWVVSAELAISGPEDNAPTEAEAEAMREKIAAELPDDLATPQAVDWLKAIHKITIKPATIRQWASRGHITRTNDEGWPTYNPAELLLQARRDMVAPTRKMV